MMQFNNAFLKYDQEGFQEILFVGVIKKIILDALNDSYSWFFCTNVFNVSWWKSSNSINKWRLLLIISTIKTRSD
jgi:hypothetical protein